MNYLPLTEVNSMQEAANSVFELCGYSRIRPNNATDRELLFDIVCVLRKLSRTVHHTAAISYDYCTKNEVGNESFELQENEIDAKAYAYLYMLYEFNCDDALDSFTPKIRLRTLARSEEILKSGEFKICNVHSTVCINDFLKKKVEYNQSHRRKWRPIDENTEQLCYSPSEKDTLKIIDACRSITKTPVNTYSSDTQAELEALRLLSAIYKAKDTRPIKHKDR